MDRGHFAKPLRTTTLPEVAAVAANLIEVQPDGASAIVVTCARPFRFVFAKDRDKAVAMFADAGTNAPYGVYRGCNINYEIPCAGETEPLYIVADEDTTSVARAITIARLITAEG